MSELQKRLLDLFASRRRVPMIGGQMIGQEVYSLRASGAEIEALMEAADALDARDAEIARLTAELAQTQRDRQAEHDLRVTMQGEAETLRARLAEAERDAGRYRWLRTRINWCDQEDRYLNTVTRYRAWTHCDYRMNPPASEHIDEYIDAARGGT